NSLEIKAFDLVGNGSTEMIEVLVEGSNKLQILDQKVFPNPAKTLTNFEIKHNRAGENLLIRLEIINLEGRILFAENQRLVEAKQIIGDLTWIFLQNQTKYPAKGTYIYRVTLQSELDGSMDFTSGKIVIE
ncbi:MAG TPA: peptidase C25, partial [Algoriphagus sp.]